MERLGANLRTLPELSSEASRLLAIVQIALRMLQVITDMHRSGWAHGDAHAENWMTPIAHSVSADPAFIKLIDFGWTPLTPAQKLHDLCGTVSDPLCILIREIYYLPRTQENDRQYDIIKSLLSAASGNMQSPPWPFRNSISHP